MNFKATRVCIAGITGRVGRGVAEAIHQSQDLILTAAVSRSAAGKTVEQALGLPGVAIPISGSVEEALTTPCDVLVDFTHAAVVRAHVMTAIERGTHVVVGTSGLTDADFEAFSSLALHREVGVFAAGNFALTAVLLQRFAVIAARHVPTWEVIDYASEGKPDAPSGTARELASKLASVGASKLAQPIEQTLGDPAARGATVNGSQLHSVRMGGFISSIEVLFGMSGERLSIRHDAVDSTKPYVSGTLLAVRKVSGLRGVVRGLEALLDGQ